ncbi:MAG: acylphosphatase [Deltaproteobacteria bacterium]|nr:acylphosphatase [Deltaproteobacteria bacterium]
MSDIIRRRVVVSGMVQGVFFRAYARDAARGLGVKGWVRNLPNGNVEAVVEGTPERVQAMVAWFRTGSPMSRVDEVKVHEEPSTGEFTDFEVTFSRGRYW